MPRVFAFVSPCLLWLFLMRDFVFCRIPVNMDTNAIYGDTKFYFNNLLNGVVPLWNPYVALGRHFYAIAICNLFNPITQLVPILKILGVNYDQAFVIYMVVYFFIGCIGFYFLAKEILQDRSMAYLAYVALMFSSLGASMFTQLTFLEIVVPVIWFFFFLLRFARRQNAGNFLGLAFSKMVIISSYLPFYFMTVFLSFLVLVVVLYTRAVKDFCVNTCRFMFKFWRLVLWCVLGGLLSMAPLMAYKILDSRGEVVAPGRHCEYTSAQECYDRTMGRQGGMSYDEITHSGTLGERLDMQYLFGHLDKISYGSDSLIFLPVWIFILLGTTVFLRLTRLTALLSLMTALIALAALGQACELFGFLYHHILFFAYFRNLFFLAGFLVPLLVLLAVYQLQMLLALIPKHLTAKKLLIVAVIGLHAGMALFLRHFEGVPSVTYLTLGCSALALTVYILKVERVVSKIWLGIFAILMVLEPAWALRAYAVNAKEFTFSLPSQHVKPVFAWKRPLVAPVTGSRLYQFVHYEDLWYEMTMTDAPPKVEFPQSTTRWTFDLSERTPQQVLANYAQYKFVLYSGPGAKGDPVQGPSRDLDVNHFDANDLNLKTDFSKPQLLVYNDSYTSSWKAYLDGAPTALLRVNEAFKGINVPAGLHTIEFKYGPPGGQWVYVAATAVLFIFLLCTLFMLNCDFNG